MDKILAKKKKRRTGIRKSGRRSIPAVDSKIIRQNRMVDLAMKEVLVNKDLMKMEEGGKEKWLCIWDEEHPRSLINLVSERVKEEMKKGVVGHPDFFDRDERDLLLLLKRNALGPSPMDNRIRLKFWMEYDYCQHYQKEAIDLARVTSGICSFEYFYRKYITCVSKLSWMLCPPTGYVVKSEEALEFGLDQLREILELPLVDANGKVNASLANIKVRITEMLDNRVKGAVVQKNISYNMHALSNGDDRKLGVEAREIGLISEDKTYDKLLKRLSDLRGIERGLENGGAGRKVKQEAVGIEAGNDIEENGAKEPGEKQEE